MASLARRMLLGIFAGLTVFLTLISVRVREIQAEDELLELYYADPAQIVEYTPTPLTLTGVFPAVQAITTLEAASEAYRVYIGAPPWTEDHIAPFRLGPADGFSGPDDTVITAYDPEYANQMYVTSPAFTPPGWVGMEVVD